MSPRPSTFTSRNFRNACSTAAAFSAPTARTFPNPQRQQEWRMPPTTRPDAAANPAPNPYAAGLFNRFATNSLAALLLFLSGCTVGPKYVRPAAQAPPAYKELT